MSKESWGSWEDDIIVYGAHLCNRCLNKYDLYLDPNHWGVCAKLKEKKGLKK